MYIRMVLLMAISFYTARIVLQKLGIDNFGIYNLVGSLVVFFGYISNGLSIATKRYITTSVGSGHISYARHVFNICQQAHFIIAAFMLVSAEIIGPWIIYKYLKIPEGRQFAAQVVYQISVATTALSIAQSPYGASIVAYEKMDVYAYFSGIEVVLKLAVVFLLKWLPGDKLILYALLIMAIGCINMAVYSAYSISNFPICKFSWVVDKPLMKEVLVFTGWSVFGQTAVVLTNHGVGILANLFFGVVVNAAIGVSNSITNIVTQFLSNFQIAFNPQIIKSYNSNDFEYLRPLLLMSSKISSYLIMFFLIPLVFVVSEVMQLWLGVYPEYSEKFCIYTLYGLYIEAISGPLFMLIYAQKNIRKYQIVISVVYAQCFTLAWLALYMGAKPYYIIIMRLLVYIVLLGIRLVFVKKLMPLFDLWEWFYEILLKSLSIFGVSILSIYFFVGSRIHFQPLNKIMVITLISFLINIPLMFFIGLSSAERTFVLLNISKWFKRRFFKA